MDSGSLVIESVDRACQLIHQRRPMSPVVGIILGSGLGSLASQIQHSTSIHYSEIPGFPSASASGHAGALILGFMSGVPVIVMQGRAHLYEGHSAKLATFPVRCMHALGAQTLIVSNASGGLNPRFQCGDLVVIDQHIDWMLRSGVNRCEASEWSSPMGVPHRNSHVYAPQLVEQAQRAAIACGFGLSRGTYLATLGPSYETRAEYRMFRTLGADMVGMSTVPEVLVARAIGMEVLALSVITNMAKPDSVPGEQRLKTSHEEVLDWAERAKRRMIPLVSRLLSEWSGPPD